MTCGEAQNLVHAYLDGELDAAGTAEVARHVESCATCGAALRRMQALQGTLRDEGLYWAPPEGLTRRVRAAVRRAHPTRGKLYRLGLPMLGIAASLGLVAVVTWGIGAGLQRASTQDLLVREVIAGHVRSLQAEHLTDVASSDQHTVKPWFAGRLDFSPPVPYLAERGYPLLGGRLDYLNGRPVAALVYQRRKHFINVFIWPAGGQVTAERALSREGYNLLHWSDGELTYWAVSDVAADDLAEFMREFRAAGPRTMAKS